MTCSCFSNPSAEILHVDDISYAAFGHQILQGAFVRIGILALGVLQILNMWSPCSVGSIILFDPRAAWECEFRFFQHLCGENARNTGFLNKSQRILQVLRFATPLRWKYKKDVIHEKSQKGYYKFSYLRCPWVRRFFVIALKSVIPTQRGHCIWIAWKSCSHHWFS